MNKVSKCFKQNLASKKCVEVVLGNDQLVTFSWFLSISFDRFREVPFSVKSLWS